jgi:hypothetical protein
MKQDRVPLAEAGLWGYGSAAMSSAGELWITASEGGWDTKGKLMLSLLRPGEQWQGRVIQTPFRHCYTYLLPHGASSLNIVSSRDTTWESLGMTVPAGSQNDYAFNAYRVWTWQGFPEAQPRAIHRAEQRPSSGEAQAVMNAQFDAFLDSAGQLHLIVHHRSAETKGRTRVLHRVLDAAGDVILEEPMPEHLSPWMRVFELRGSLWLLAGSGEVLELQPDGRSTGKSQRLDLGGLVPEYPGFTISCPRGGGEVGQVLHAAFPSQKQGQWSYLSLSQ